MKTGDEILEGLLNKKPEELEGESKKLFEAIMKIADDRDKYLKELKNLKENYITKEKHKKALNDKYKYVTRQINRITAIQFNLNRDLSSIISRCDDLLNLEKTIEKIEDVLDDVNIESYNELVDVFLEIRRIIEKTKILESEE